jgi:uncharacterized protein (TIGR01244 family)
MLAMRPTRISPDFSVSAQIEPADLREIRRLGFRSVMCNRPDGEAAGQADAEIIRAEAELHGLAFAYLPVISGAIVPEDVSAFRETIEAMPAPVLAYCRSGARCQNLWLLAQR